tara:strand:- start:73942 stop:74142 length:201 start_codon:yes stop_codon:yes gene_type:complete
MKSYQEFTPKYWIVNDKLSNDVIIETASKGRHGTVMLMDKFIGNSQWEGNENFEVILVEIKEVEVY